LEGQCSHDGLNGLLCAPTTFLTQSQFESPASTKIQPQVVDLTLRLHGDSGGVSVSGTLGAGWGRMSILKGLHCRWKERVSFPIPESQRTSQTVSDFGNVVIILWAIYRNPRVQKEAIRPIESAPTTSPPQALPPRPHIFTPLIPLTYAPPRHFGQYSHGQSA